MVETGRITASQAHEMSGCESEIDLVDLAIVKAAKDGQRYIHLGFELLRSKWKQNVCDSLVERGFRIDHVQNPTSLRVSW